MASFLESVMDNTDKNKDLEEDEELAALRLAALLSRKSTAKTSEPVPEINKYTTPISSIVKATNNTAQYTVNTIPYIKNDRTQVSVYNQQYSWRKQPVRRRGGPVQKTNLRSNLIVISPISTEEKLSSVVTEKPSPPLILPQSKWCQSGNEDSMSPKSYRRMGPTRFNRHESDSESSDTDVDEKNDNDSCSRETILQDEPLEHSSELDGLAPRNISAPESDDASTKQDDSVSNSNLLSFENNLGHSSITDTERTTPVIKDFSDCFSSSDDNSTDSGSETSFKRSQSVKENLVESDKLLSPLHHGNYVANEDVSLRVLDVESVSHEQSKNCLSPCYNENVPEQQVEALAYDASDTVSLHNHKRSIESANLDDGHQDNTLVTKLVNSNHVEDVENQLLSNNDLRFALKKKMQERKQGRKDRMDQKNNDVRFNRSHSRSSSSSSISSSLSGSTSSSSSRSSSPAVRTISSVVKPVYSRKLHRVKKTSSQGSRESSPDKHRNNFESWKLYDKHGMSSDSADHSQCTKKLKESDEQSKYSSSIKVQLSEINRSRDLAPDGSNKKRVPVHLRLGNLPRKRVIEMTDDTRFSNTSGDDDNAVNIKCKKRNLRIVTEVFQSKKVDDDGSNDKQHKRSDHHSSKERSRIKASR